MRAFAGLQLHFLQPVSSLSCKSSAGTLISKTIHSPLAPQPAVFAANEAPTCDAERIQ